MTAHTFSAALNRIAKEQPGVSDVHVPASGARKRSIHDRLKRLAERRNGVAKVGPLTHMMAALGFGMGADGEPYPLDIDKAAQPRALKAIDAENSHTPFPHDAGAFANMRPDQIPRFLGALTDIDGQEDRTVRLNTLVAMQDRVNHGKVEEMRASDRARPPLVVRMGGKNYIADGHHRLAAAWLNGATTADVKFIDLTARSQAVKSAPLFEVPITKTDEDQNLVFGWASVISENGVPVKDSQGHVIDEEELEKAFYEYALSARVAGEMHDEYGAQIGKMVECMVFTKAKQDALGIDLGKIGAWVGYKVAPAVFAKIKDGTYKMLSIGGSGRLETMS